MDKEMNFKHNLIKTIKKYKIIFLIAFSFSFGIIGSSILFSQNNDISNNDKVIGIWETDWGYGYEFKEHGLCSFWLPIGNPVDCTWSLDNDVILIESPLHSNSTFKIKDNFKYFITTSDISDASGFYKK